MKTSLPIAKINGRIVHGQAHIQPGVNSWIGVCVANENVLDYDSVNMESVIIEYEGPFNCRTYDTNGKGKAKILSISQTLKNNHVTITFEGVDKPELERKLIKDLSHSYNENLPAYINDFKALEKREVC